MLIHKKVIGSLSPEFQGAIFNAFSVLTQVGLWESLIRFETELLLTGALEEEPAKLAARILETRNKIAILQELHNIGKV